MLRCTAFAVGIVAVMVTARVSGRVVVDIAAVALAFGMSVVVACLPQNSWIVGTFAASNLVAAGLHPSWCWCWTCWSLQFVAPSGLAPYCYRRCLTLC